MANVQHASLPDAELHEPKGAAAAAADSFYVSNGSGSGSWKRRLYKYTASITPASVSANTSAEQTFTVTGLIASSDYIIGIEPPAGPTAGTGIVWMRITADNTIGITFINATGGGLTPPAGTYTFIIWRD